MSIQRIYIKNMVCPRCIEAVREIFVSFGYPSANVLLGAVEIKDDLIDLSSLEENLSERGFELIREKDEELLVKTKSAVIQLIHYLDENPNLMNSAWLEEHLNERYQKISKHFSKKTGQTLEKYIIQHKIERAKELISYDQLSVKEIATKIGYKSVAHLSRQFKDLTKMSITEYKNSNVSTRINLDKI